jgi:hypothetical protein
MTGFKVGDRYSKMKSILDALREVAVLRIALISEETVEQSIKAFLEWASKASGLRDVYVALRAAILKGWRG